MRYISLCVVLFLSFRITAQDTNNIILGETVTVSVSAAQPATLTFVSETEEQIVTVTAQAVDNEDVDPVVWVTDSSNNLLAYNNNKVAADAQITNLILPTIGQYTVHVDSFNGVSNGEVEVSIVATDIFAMQIEQSNNVEIIQLTIPEDSMFTYPLLVTSGDIWTITVYDSNGKLDPYLRIRDSRGTIISHNDDHQSTDSRLNIFDAQISELEVATDETYFIEVFDFIGRAGELTLEIQQRALTNP